MTDGYSRQAVINNTSREPAAIIGLDLTTKTATAYTRSKYTVQVNCNYAVGETYIVPAIGEQWYVERFDMEWRLAGQIPHNDDTTNIEPEAGQRSIGSTTGPLELNGTEVRINAPFRLGITLFRTNATTGKLEYSLDGTSWVPVSAAGSGGGGGSINSTDDLPEGSTNKYFTVARAAAAAPVRTVATRTGDVVLAKADVGLGNVDNTADNAKPVSSATATALAAKADLVAGIVPTGQLPPPVVRQYANVSSFPAPGTAGVIYVAGDTGNLYRWDGSSFTFAGGGGGGGGGGAANTDALPEGTSNLYFTNARASAAAPVQSSDTRLTNTRTPTDNTVTTAKIVDANVTTAKIADGAVTTAKIDSSVTALINAPKPYDVSYPVTFGVRAVGLGLNTIGVRITRAVTFTKVFYRCGVADGSGSATFELRKNGTAVAGTSVTIGSVGQVAGDSATGSWSFVEGDILTVAITAVGTTPGTGLVADVTGVS